MSNNKEISGFDDPRVKRAVQVFDLKSKVGALSDREKALVREVALMKSLMEGPFDGLDRAKFSFLIKREVGRNANDFMLEKLLDTLNDAKKKLGLNDERQATPSELAQLFFLVLAFFDTWTSIADKEAAVDEPKTRAFTDRYVAHVDARKDGKAHTSGI